MDPMDGWVVETTSPPRRQTFIAAAAVERAEEAWKDAAPPTPGTTIPSGGQGMAGAGPAGERESRNLPPRQISPSNEMTLDGADYT